MSVDKFWSNDVTVLFDKEKLSEFSSNHLTSPHAKIVHLYKKTTHNHSLEKSTLLSTSSTQLLFGSFELSKYFESNLP